jgi:hypothetical protein
MLIDFSIAGHEDAADVPEFSHPDIPPEKLENLKVVQLIEMPDNHTYINYPREIQGYRCSFSENRNDSSSESMQNDRRSESINKEFKEFKDIKVRIPDVKAYFFRRWVWTNYPLLALLGDSYLWASPSSSSSEKRPEDKSDSVLMFSVGKVETIFEPPVTLTKTSASNIEKNGLKLTHSKSAPLFSSNKLPEIMKKRDMEVSPEREYDVRIANLMRTNEHLSLLFNQLHERRLRIEKQVKSATETNRLLSSELAVLGSGGKSRSMLEEKICIVQNNMDRSDKMGEVFRKIIAFCEANPPKSKKSIENLTEEHKMHTTQHTNVKKQLKEADMYGFYFLSTPLLSP